MLDVIQFCDFPSIHCSVVVVKCDTSSCSVKAKCRVTQVCCHHQRHFLSIRVRAALKK